MASDASTERLYVIDTSSVIDVRRLLSPASVAELKRVYDQLTRIVVSGRLVFPVQVVEELEWGHESLGDADDLPFEWARDNRISASPKAALFAAARRVLEVAPTLLDADKVTGRDEADPYVVGLALELHESGRRVTVITEDRVDRPDKMSMQSACGLLELPAVSMRVFLDHQGIWPRNAGRGR
jgi:hypothetical protein